MLKYKELVGGNENSDLIITLSKALKAEKERSALLEQEIKDLQQNGGTDKSSPDKGKTSQPNLTSPEKTTEPKKDSNVFSLPKEN